MNEDEIREQLEAEYDRVIKETLERLRRSKPLTRAKIAEALMRANKTYWAARLAITDSYGLAATERVASALAVPYIYACEELVQQVRQVFTGYQSAFNLTQKDAKELIDKVVYDRSIAENLQRIADTMPESAEKTRILAEISAPAYRYRMQRAEQVAVNAKNTLEDIARGEVAVDRQFLQTEIEKSYNITLEEAQRLPPSEAVVVELTGEPEHSPVPEMPKADEPVQDFTPTPEHGIMDSFSTVPTDHVNEIISRDWSGQSFSERIWNNTDDLARDVKDVLLDGVLTGKGIDKMARTIRDKYGTGMHRARTLVRTEYNYCVNQSQLKSLAAAGYDEYEFLSVGEGEDGACDMCDDLDGMRFKITDAVVGVNCPPMHPNCRCNAISPRETDEDVQADIDRLLDGRSIEDIERELDRQIEEKEEAERLLSAPMSGEISSEENLPKPLTFDSGSDIIKADENVPRPANEPEYLKQFDVYDPSTRSEEEILAQINPGYVKGRGGEREINCVNAATAYEMVKKGYDVSAKAFDSNLKDGNQIKTYWNIDTQNGFVGSKIQDFKKDAYDYLSKWDADAQDTARAIIGTYKLDGAGHAINAEFISGAVRYVDGQSGKLIDIDSYLSTLDNNYPLFTARVDNILPTPLIINAIENRK